MNIKDNITLLIRNTLNELGMVIQDINLEHPEQLDHGDYSTNVALVLSKQIGKKPVELAKEIVEVLKKRIPKEIVKVEVAGPGFINFYLSNDFFFDSIRTLANRVSITEEKEKKKIMVEYTDANPLKEFHIGHLMSNTIGESIARLCESVGNEVKRACYQGDVGLHIAKAVWGALKQKEESGAIDWVTAYPKGAQAYEDSEVVKKEIEEINKKIYSKDPELFHIYEEGRKVSLEKFEEVYKKLGTKFDYHFFESEIADTGKKLVEDNLGKIFEKSDGAVVFHGEKYDPSLHTRVFINSQGIPTYEAKELGLAKIKSDKYDADKFLVVTGNEIAEYFKVLKTALSLIYPEIANKTVHYPHGMLRLPSGKMSSRTGKVITAESLLNTIQEMVAEKIKNRDFDDIEKRNVAEKVAVGAVKYSILKSSVGSDIVFDFDKSISFEGDSGPYLQYSYARAMSVLRKVGEDFKSDSDKAKVNGFELGNLEKKLYRFEEVVKRSASELEPHFITSYITELAGDFNSFYGNNQIIDEKNKEMTAYRISLTKAFANVLKRGMEILAIPLLERM